MLMALISPWLRYRKGLYRERQQIKWLALFGGSCPPAQSWDSSSIP